MSDIKKTKSDFLEVELSSPVELADFREYFRSSSNFASRVVFKLCDELAKERGWDLEAAMPEAIAQREARFAKEDAERKAKREAEEEAQYERRVKNYVKKHGHAPPTQADKDAALAKLTPIERKALGL